MNAHTYNAPTISAGTITRTAVLEVIKKSGGQRT